MKRMLRIPRMMQCTLPWCMGAALGLHLIVLGCVALLCEARARAAASQHQHDESTQMQLSSGSHPSLSRTRVDMQNVIRVERVSFTVPRNAMSITSRAIRSNVFTASRAQSTKPARGRHHRVPVASSPVAPVTPPSTAQHIVQEAAVMEDGRKETSVDADARSNASAEQLSRNAAQTCWEEIGAALQKRADTDLPENVQHRGLQGQVVVQFRLDAQGMATDVDLIGSSGNALLDDTARWLLRLPFIQSCPGIGRWPVVFGQRSRALEKELQ